MKAHSSSTRRSKFTRLLLSVVLPAALAGCRPGEPDASGDAPPSASSTEAVAVSQPEGTLSTAMPPEEVFKRALWRRPAADDKILHAERREWTKDSAAGVARWQWFLAIEPGPALKAWLREQNPFSVRPVGNSEAPEIEDPPAWFPSDNSGCIVHTGGNAGSLVFLWSREGNTLYATGSGTGFQPGAPEPAPPAAGTQTASGGRLPQTPPPTSPTP